MINISFLYITFQFALPRGERPTHHPRPLRDAGFQFALPRGERRYS